MGKLYNQFLIQKDYQRYFILCIFGMIECLEMTNFRINFNSYNMVSKY